MKPTLRKYVIARAQWDADSMQLNGPRTREDFEKRLAPNMRENVDQSYALYVEQFNLARNL